MNTKQRIVITVSVLILIARCLWVTPMSERRYKGYRAVNYERLVAESTVVVIAASGLVLLWRDKKKARKSTSEEGGEHD